MPVLFFDHNDERRTQFYQHLLIGLGVKDDALNKTIAVVGQGDVPDFVATVPEISDDNMQKYWERVFCSTRVAEDKGKRLLAVFFMDKATANKDDVFIKQVIRFLTYYENVGRVFDIKIITTGFFEDTSLTSIKGSNISITMAEYSNLEEAFSKICDVVSDYLEVGDLLAIKPPLDDTLEHQLPEEAQQKPGSTEETNPLPLLQMIQMNMLVAPKRQLSFLSKNWTEKLSSVFSYGYGKKGEHGWLMSGIRGLWAVLLTVVFFIPVTVFHLGARLFGKLAAKKDLLNDASENKINHAYQNAVKNHFHSQANEADKFFATATATSGTIGLDDMRSHEAVSQIPLEITFSDSFSCDSQEPAALSTPMKALMLFSTPKKGGPLARVRQEEKGDTPRNVSSPIKCY